MEETKTCGHTFDPWPCCVEDVWAPCVELTANGNRCRAKEICYRPVLEYR